MTGPPSLADEGAARGGASPGSGGTFACSSPRAAPARPWPRPAWQPISSSRG